ncbi:helix-turn-helix domain-containing protein [Mucilaginibacter sp. AW1-3]
MEVLAKNIRSLRQQYGWSQGDIAAKLGISIPAFSKIETGVTDVNLSRLEQIAAVFSVPLTNLLATEDVQANVDQQIEVEAVMQKVLERESQISALQKKVIVLYEELRKKQNGNLS